MSSCGTGNHHKQHTHEQEIQEIPAAYYPHKVVSADFNNDSRHDIAVISKNGILRVFFNDAQGFKDPLELQAHPYSVSLSADDLNGDGNVDLAVLTEGHVGPFFLGDGTEGFITQDSPLYYPAFGKHMESSDLNNDGMPDLIVTGGAYVVIYINSGNMSFDDFSFFLAVEEVFLGKYITAFDLDGNGFRDIILTNYPHGKLYVIWNSGNNIFSTPDLVFESKFQTMSAAVPISLSGETLPALCISLESSGVIVVLKNNGGKEFQEIERISVTRNPHHLTVADMNGDGIDDIVVTHAAAYSGEKGAITILFGPLPNPSMISFSTTEGHPMAATATDWDMDGYHDLFLPNYDADTVTFIPSPGKGN
jgi:hypothetical protein